MVRRCIGTLAALAWIGFAGTSYSAGEKDITESQVLGLVKLTTEHMTKDAKGTLEKINKGQHPYVDKDNQTLYVFIYDMDMVVVAHHQDDIRGKSQKGKPDAKGKFYRDEIFEKANKDGKGWVDYTYRKPGDVGVHPKKSFFQLVTGNDGKKYIVVAGMYGKQT